MPHNRTLQALAERLAGELLAAGGGTARASVRAGGRVCVVQVLPAGGAGGREGCRADILAVLARAKGPLLRKEVVKALHDAGHDHGPGTVAKALAELTGSGVLVNPKDQRGYRLAEWVRPHPGLFDHLPG